MPLTKLLINPEQASYAVDYGDSVVTVGIDGGKGKYRSDIDNPSSVVKCKWVMDRGSFEYFRAFYKTVTLNAASPFLIDLIIDDSDLTEHTAHFIPASYRLTGQRGLMYEITCNIEAIPIPTDEEYDEGIIMTFTEYGSLEAGDQVYNLLEEFVNVTYPGAMA